MASTSVRNLASHLAAVSYSNFRPVPEKWCFPKKLPKGSSVLLDMMLNVTGAHFKPIFHAYILNEDCTSQYYFAGTSSNYKWARVTKNTIQNRNKDSMWSNTDSIDGICKGIRVKYACGGSAAGFLYPICIIISGLSKDEMPKEEFVVIPIEGLSINGHVDPRNKEVGYTCLIGSHVPQKHFCDWFNENVTYPTIQSIRKKFNPMSSGDAVDGQVPIDQEVCMWGDSDIPYLQQMTDPERIKLSISRGVYFAKNGAKITENAQPLDLGPFFKILKRTGSSMTSVGIETPLSILLLGHSLFSFPSKSIIDFSQSLFMYNTPFASSKTFTCFTFLASIQTNIVSCFLAITDG